MGSRATFSVVGIVLVGVFLSSVFGKGSLTEPERINAEKAIYAAAMRQFAEDHLTTFSEILIEDWFSRTCVHNGVEWVCNYGGRSDPLDRLSEDMKSEISTALKEIEPRFRFIDSKAGFVRDNGGFGGEPAIPGSVLAGLDHVEFDEDGATVSVGSWCGGLCSSKVTYRVTEVSDNWVVTETLSWEVS